MGLPTPTGAGSEIRLIVTPAPVACNGLCYEGTRLYTSNIHNCGSWSFSGLHSYTPPSPGSYCVIAVACGNDGWSCGGATAIDGFIYNEPSPAVGDWVLY
jgi:hypothetical protein